MNCAALSRFRPATPLGGLVRQRGTQQITRSRLRTTGGKCVSRRNAEFRGDSWWDFVPPYETVEGFLPKILPSRCCRHASSPTRRCPYDSGPSLGSASSPIRNCSNGSVLPGPRWAADRASDTPAGDWSIFRPELSLPPGEKGHAAKAPPAVRPCRPVVQSLGCLRWIGPTGVSLQDHSRVWKSGR